MTRPTAAAGVGDSYIWVGAAGDAWSAPEAWFDRTTGTAGGSRPGADDSVSISNADVRGAGAAQVASLQGFDTLAGTFAFGTLDTAFGIGDGGAHYATNLTGHFNIGLLQAAGLVDVGTSIGRVTTLDVNTVRLGDQAWMSTQKTEISVAGGVFAEGTIALGAGSTMRANRLQLHDVEGGSGRPTALVTVDSTSSFEVGSGGKAAKGAVTVDPGATISGSGYINVRVIDDGVVEASGGALSVYQISGSGEVRIGAHSFFSGYVAASLAVRFMGPGAVLDALSTRVGASYQPTLVGFAAGDVIQFLAGYYPQSVSVTPISGGETVSVLGYGTSQPIAEFTLTGPNLPTDFLVVANLNTGSPYVTSALVALPDGNGTGAPSAGTQSGDVFRWTGGAGPEWGVAQDWVDLTRGGLAQVAPGARDSVVFSDVGGVPALLAGVGEAKSMLVDLASGELILDGRFDIGTLHLRRGPIIAAGAGCVVTAGSVVASGGTADTVAVSHGASLDASSIAWGNWTVSLGGMVRTDRLGGTVKIGVDTASSFEVGTAGHAASGALTIDAGVTVVGDVTAFGNSPFIPSGLMVVDGTVVGALHDNGDLRLSGTLEVHGTANVTGSTSGTGRVVIGAESEFIAGSTPSGNSLSGVTIDFAGAGGRLAVSQYTRSSSATLVHFGRGDAILGADYLPIQFTPNGHDGGTLVLGSVGSPSTITLNLVGDYARARFLSVADPTLNGRRELVVAPGVDGRIVAGPGAGTARALAWSTPGSVGAWGSAANWTNTATGQAAGVAAGHLDQVTIGNPYSAPSVVYGAGDAASLTAYGTVLNGRFTARSVTLTGSSVAGVGSALTASTAVANGTTITGGRFTAAAATVVGALTVSNGGAVAFGTLTLSTGYISVDATSRAYIGAGKPTGPAGVLTVAAGATLSGSGAIGAAVVDNGTIAISTLSISGAVSGHGRIDVGAVGPGGSLVLQAGVSAATDIAFIGNAAQLVLADPAHMKGTILGLTFGDTIEAYGLTTAASAHFEPANASGGQLVIDDAKGNALASLHLGGNYADATFDVSIVNATANLTLTSFHGTA